MKQPRDKNGRFASFNEKRKSTSSKRKSRAIKATTILNAFLMDNSTSMAERSKDGAVVEGFNKVLLSGRKDATDNKIDNKEFVAFFDNDYNNFSSNVSQLQLQRGSYSPRTGYKNGESIIYNPSAGGSTALHSSAYKFIKDMEKEFEKYNPKTTKVVLTIFTDGEENHSYVHPIPTGHDGKNWAQLLKETIEEKNKAGWVVTYVGAGDRATVEKTAIGLGFYASNTANYANTASGASATMDSLSVSRGAYVSSAAKGTSSNKGFFQKEKKEKV